MSHPTLGAGALALVCAILEVVAGWPVYQQHQNDRSAQRLQDPQQRLAAQATSIHAVREQDQTMYACTAKNGIFFTAPSRSELNGLCGQRS